MGYVLQEIARQISAEVLAPEGAIAKEISGVASVESATAWDLVFAESPESLDKALASKAAAVIAGDFARVEQPKKFLLIAEQPKLAFARAAAMLERPVEGFIGVHATAVVHATAKLALGTSVGPHCVIQSGVATGARTRIGPNCVLGTNVVLGADCVLEANVTIYPGTRLGDRVIVHAQAVLGGDGFGFVRDKSSRKYEKFPQVGRLEIGDDVEIGCGTTIDRGALDATVIGRGTKIDNLVHIAHNVSIGEEVVIAAQTGISGSTRIGNHCVIGGQVGIGDHAQIGDGVILGSKSGVLTGKKLSGEGVVFWGTPAKPLPKHLRELATLNRLSRKK